MKWKPFALLCAAAVLLWPVRAYADLIIEPFNDFYRAHYEECEQVRRTFITNGPDGSVTARTEPGSGEVMATIPNGQELFVSFAYSLDGQYWGAVSLTEYLPPQESPETGDEDDIPAPLPAGSSDGWIPLDQTLLKYDTISFYEDHEDELYDYTGGYDSVDNAQRLVFWTYPGSGETAGIHESADWGDFQYRFEYAYRDGDGLQWGYVGDRTAAWLCIDNLSSQELPAANYNPSTGVWTPEGGNSPGMKMDTLLMILVGALVAGTGILIRVFWKPSKQDK